MREIILDGARRYNVRVLNPKNALKKILYIIDAT
jgi:hypothetical protein